jgi:hypothetical protein
MKNTGNVLGDYIRFYLPILDGVKNFFAENDFNYAFYRDDFYTEIKQKDFAEGELIKVNEALMMTHMVAATSLLRGYYWLSEVSVSIINNNPFSFSACLRGFLEASADTYYSLNGVGESLVNNRESIISVLKKEGKYRINLSDIENTLIHYLRARQVWKNEEVPNNHKRKQFAEYFEALDDGLRGDVAKLYNELSELAHPSEGSVSIFINENPIGIKSLNYKPKYDIFADVSLKHSKAIEKAFMCGINISLVTLKVLNEFPKECFHTPILDNSRFDVFQLGKRIKKTLNKATW